MLKKTIGILFISLVLILTACQGNNEKEVDDQNNQPEKEEPIIDDSKEPKDSEEDDRENLEDDAADKEKGENNADENTGKQESDTVKEEKFDSKQEAIDAIDDYEEVDQTNTDLGHGIKARVEGAAGHQYVAWNEGRWLIVVDFPNDSQYAVEGYEDGKEMAKAIVNYLEDNMLPAPEERGVIKVRGFSDGPEIIVRWQEGNKVYELKDEATDPTEVLQKVVDYEANK